MTLFLPLVLIGPVMMLIVAVLSLASRGPLGVLTAIGLVLAVVIGIRAVVRRTLIWWASTKAPVIPTGSSGPWQKGGQSPQSGGSDAA